MRRGRQAVLPVVLALVASGAMVLDGADATAGTRPSAPDRFLGHAVDRGTTMLSRLGAARSPVTRESVTPAPNELPERPENGEGAEDPVPAPITPDTPVVPSTSVDATSPNLVQGWEGLNHFDSRFASHGNQFSGEPPDQGLCAGEGAVLEMVNSVIEVSSAEDGTALSAPTALNRFWRYPPEVDRASGTYGPFLFDVECRFDRQTETWFLVSDHLDQDPATGDVTGIGSVDLAVSRTSDPLGTWRLYTIPTQNDGTAGTPDHGCLGAHDRGHGPCFADYPHIGLDAYGLFLMTNEYAWLADADFKGSNIYAFSKRALINGGDVPFVLKGPLQVPELGQHGFTVWPANGAGKQYDLRNGGTEYFLSSNATNDFEVGTPDGYSNQIVLWALTNTSSLDAPKPRLRMRHVVVPTGLYGVPPHATQAPGETPLLDCLAVDCLGLGATSAEPMNRLDTGDSRMQQTWIADGVVWGSLGTVTLVDGQPQAGVFYVGIRPGWKGGTLSGRATGQGYLATQGAALSYPAIAVNRGGDAVLAFTLVGSRTFPTAAFSVFPVSGSPTSIQVGAAGLGPEDGFTGTSAFDPGALVSRWGDYGAATLGGGGTFWIASEYIAQTCTLQTFAGDTTCAGTRSALANWSTRVSQVVP